LSKTFDRILQLVQAGSVRISEHGYDEMAADDILARDVIRGVAAGVVVEDYPDYPKGSCVLALQRDRDGQPIMWCGVFPRTKWVPQCLSPRIGPIENDGKMIFEGGGDEKTAPYEADPRR
jgi:hypothetical protein